MKKMTLPMEHLLYMTTVLISFSFGLYEIYALQHR